MPAEFQLKITVYMPRTIAYFVHTMFDHESKTSRTHSAASLLFEFIRHPSQTGAIAPSSKSLAKCMVEWLDLANANVVLEYGPGTGAFTPFVVDRLKPGCRFLAIERNPALAQIVRSRWPHVLLIEDSVENVRAICTREGVEFADCIISGLPWASFPDDLQVRLLDAMMTVLRPGGQFVTFAYLHGLPLRAGRAFYRRLPAYFGEVTQSSPVWLNLPPALVYRCRKT